MYFCIWRGRAKGPPAPNPLPALALHPYKMTLSVNECSCQGWECLLLPNEGLILIWLQGLVPQTVNIKDFKVGTSDRDFSLQLKSV